MISGFMNMPVEFSIGEVYFPPVLIASLLGLILTVMLTRALNTYRWSQYFYYPPLVFVSMFVIFTILVNYVVIPF
jgi:hypothetical protein